MTKIKLAFLFLILSAGVFAQQDSTKNTDPTLQGQYRFMLSKSKTLNGYKLVNPSRLATLWQNVTDSLNAQKRLISHSKNAAGSQAETIGKLKAEIETKDEALATKDGQINEIRFIGIPFSKGTYNVMVWAIIIGLALALAVIVLTSAKNIREAKYRRQLYDEIADEYQAYKTKATEKERKLARELQDERNALDDLRGRGRV